MLDDQNLSEDDESSSYTESYESSTESDLDSDRLLDTDTDCQDSDSISKCTSTNLIQLLHQSRQNGRDHHTFDSLISCLSQYREYQFHENRFNSQITSLCWHPDRHQQLITGTASGFISLFHVPFSSDGSHSGQSNNFIGIRRSKARACKPSSHDPLPVHEQCLKEWPGMEKILQSFILRLMILNHRDTCLTQDMEEDRVYVRLCSIETIPIDFMSQVTKVD